MGKFTARSKDIPAAKPADTRGVRLSDGRVVVAEVTGASRTQIADAINGVGVNTSDAQLGADAIDYIQSEENRARLLALRAWLQQGADTSSD